MDSFKLLTRTSNISVFNCPQCFGEFSSASRRPKLCPKCRYPEKDSDWNLQIRRAKSEIHKLISEKGFVLRATELQPIVDTLMTDFPNAQRADLLGSLALDRDKIRNERYDLELHQYVERKARTGHNQQERRERRNRGLEAMSYHFSYCTCGHVRYHHLYRSMKTAMERPEVLAKKCKSEGCNCAGFQRFQFGSAKTAGKS